MYTDMAVMRTLSRTERREGRGSSVLGDDFVWPLADDREMSATTVSGAQENDKGSYCAVHVHSSAVAWLEMNADNLPGLHQPYTTRDTHALAQIL
jgi:hypothetical protein